VRRPAEEDLGTGRLSFEPVPAPLLTFRLLAWIALGVMVAAALRFLPGDVAGPGIVPPAALGASVLAVRLKRWPFALLAFVGITAIAWPLVRFGGPWAPVVGLALGVSVGLLHHGLSSPWSALNTCFAGIALGTAGLETASALGALLPEPLASSLGPLAASLATAPLLFVVRVRWKPVARIPSEGHILRSLEAPFQEASLRAWDLDRALRREAPDRETREGLGEIAAWVYRLSKDLQSLCHDLARISETELLSRIERTSRSISESEDAFVRERRTATLRRLEAMRDHREALARERERTESLVEYALATLEEARSGLALARPLPGASTPESLGPVLARLRAHTLDAHALRAAIRETEEPP
jgi:hypothetical protein